MMRHPLDDTEGALTAHRATAAEPPVTAPPLAGPVAADVAVIGGGIAGCSAALHAAEAGARVVLLEAKTIGWGASSRNAGYIQPATKQEPNAILATYGPDVGERILSLVDTGPAKLADLVERHGIDCELLLCGTIDAAHTPDAMARLERRAAFWQGRNRPVEVLDRDRFAAMTGTRFYLGGSWDKRGGSINPLSLVRGLARAAQKAGAVLHQSTPALRLEQTGEGFRIGTPSGEVTARRVVVCTNAYSDDLIPGLAGSIIPVHVSILNTEPLPSPARETILPGRQPVLDTRRLALGLRKYADGTLQFGAGLVHGRAEGPNTQWAVGRIRQIFPDLAAIRIARTWTGLMSFNLSHTWEVHEPMPGLTTALGCNGRGVLLATLYGRELGLRAAGVAGEPTLPFTPIKASRRAAAARLALPVVTSWHRLRDAGEIRRLRATA